MSLKSRAQQHNQQNQARGRATANTAEEHPQQAPINLFRKDVYGIVDGQLVQVLGVTDIPGMSLAYLCNDPDEGWTAPVSHSEIQVFPNLNRGALQQMLDAQNAAGTTGSTRTNR